uniref:hypothetical protein n=1 Tax=Gelidibacter sp. TaxID=2018083 RepID=UPI00404B8EB5
MKQLLVFIIIFPNFVFSQSSEHFKAITKNLKPVDSVKIETFYSNGNPKEKGQLLYYKVEDYMLEAYSGHIIKYHSNGTVDYDMHYDRFGNILSFKDYSRDQNLEYESTTYYLDTLAENELDFIKNSNQTINHFTERYYKCSYKLNICYIYKEGRIENGKKTGIWTTYYETGEIKSQKTY